MKPHAGFALMLMLAPHCAWADQATNATADQLFQSGKSAEAATQYRQVAEQNPSNYHATLQIGRIALLANRYADATPGEAYVQIGPLVLFLIRLSELLKDVDR